MVYAKHANKNFNILADPLNGQPYLSAGVFTQVNYFSYPIAVTGVVLRH
jgi:hypothetical protein